ncbi:DUF6152 family protein [Mesorhizobium sp. RMAD-H1]|uniref:DUF6152 family protein n=1 Tax=Mesorhizobium sp. RMAD-H1 TaxID=2587065 RepID=UPI00161E3A41|nr:DUF6152 family protein [Mesorhizobium sp. RMAD-H1]MBB2974269.1 hypothetical protein [Mesorhizobium sp. RMAD-H1]
MRRYLLLCTSFFVAVVAASQAFAHHGWPYFDTSRAFYIEGEVVSSAWRNPHPEIVLRAQPVNTLPDLSVVRLPATDAGSWRSLPEISIPAGLQPLNVDGETYTIVLAPPSRLLDWGMVESDIRPGNRLRMIGYVACDDPHEFRPELVILGDGRAIRQRSVPVPASRC